jgi:hypothetical protein
MINGIRFGADHVARRTAWAGELAYAWKTRGGVHISNRGVGIRTWCKLLTPDNYFVSLDVATGKGAGITGSPT